MSVSKFVEVSINIFGDDINDNIYTVSFDHSEK
jgi:hypothetical protein